MAKIIAKAARKVKRFYGLGRYNLERGKRFRRFAERPLRSMGKHPRAALRLGKMVRKHKERRLLTAVGLGASASGVATHKIYRGRKRKAAEARRKASLTRQRKRQAAY